MKGRGTLLFGLARAVRIQIVPKGEKLIKPRFIPFNILDKVKKNDYTELLELEGKYVIPRDLYESLDMAMNSLMLNESNTDQKRSLKEGQDRTNHNKHILIDSDQDNQDDNVLVKTSDSSNNNSNDLVAAMDMIEVERNSFLLKEQLDINDFNPNLINDHDKIISKYQTVKSGTVYAPLNIYEQELFQFVKDGNIMSLRTCIENGANINCRHPTHGASPLHIATTSMRLGKEKHLKMIEALLHLGADINSTSGNGSTPLHWAAGTGISYIVNFLLLKGADPGAVTYTWGRQVFGKDSGQTPGHWAAESGNEECIKLLAEANPLSLIVKDERGKDSKELATLKPSETLNHLDYRQFVTIELKVEQIVKKLS